MKKFFVVALIAVALALASVATACKDDDDDSGKDDPKTQTAIITGLFDNNTSVTVTGYFTNAEWNGIPATIKAGLDKLFLAPAVKTMLSGWLNKGVIIFVEKDTEYANYKTVGDGKTMHLNYAILNDENALLSALYMAGASLDINGTEEG